MYKQGEILLIPIPFSDLTSHKKRPVLVLSKSGYNEKTNDIIVAAITSNIETRDYTVSICNDDLEEGALKVDSIIRADKLYSLSQDIIIKRFGKVHDEIIKKLIEKIQLLLADN